ncbi:MAG: methionine ABC transporter ATP-binding protein, partial [Acidimicrobiales bacterium]
MPRAAGPAGGGGARIELEAVTKVFVRRPRAGRLRRRREEVRAVDGITLTIGAGEVVGYIG